MTKLCRLSKEQPHLWQRVFALSLTFLVLGTPLLFVPLEGVPNATVNILRQLVPLPIHGVLSVLIGLGLYIGTFFSRKNYIFVRFVLSIALGYSVMWLLSLVYSGLTGALTSFAVVSLWGFLTYNIFNTLRDPGFIISDLIREVRRHHDV